MYVPIHYLYILTFTVYISDEDKGEIYVTVGTFWPAGQQVKRSILHQGYDSQ